MQRSFGYIFFFFLIKEKNQINHSTSPVYAIHVKVKDMQKRESMCVC